jgi:glucuronate isomerase
MEISNYSRFIEAIRQRHNFFISLAAGSPTTV